MTVGNALRRVLLSSIEGGAITNVKIAGANHEFQTLPGVVEDVTDIILNVKSLIVKLDADEPKEMKVVAKKAGPVTAGMIEGDPSITVVNKDLVLATLTEDVHFEMTLTVDKGRGYVTAAENIADTEEQEIGTIAVDSLYSPVSRVRYATEDARVGQKTDYDRLILEIWTNGTITPEMALVEASKILRKHLNPFVQYFELGSDLANDDAVAAYLEGKRDDEVRLDVAAAIESLPASYREVVVLRDLEGLTIGELAARLAITRTAVKGRLHRARALIREYLLGAPGE